MPPPSQSPQGLVTPSGTWDGSNETNDKYKAWAAEVFAWAARHGLSVLVKIARRVADGTPSSFSPSVQQSTDQTLEEFLNAEEAGDQDEAGEKVEVKVEDAVEGSEKPASPAKTRSGLPYKPVDGAPINPEDFAPDDMLTLLQGGTVPGNSREDLESTMFLLRNQLFLKVFGKGWNDWKAQALPNQKTLDRMHDQTLQTELRSLNRTFIAGLRNNLFGLHPKAGNFADRLQLVYPFLFSVEIDALLQDDTDTLDSRLWFTEPWRMPAVKAWVAVLRLATSAEGVGTGMLLADLKDLIDASMTPNGLTAPELDAKADSVLKILDRFKTAKEIKDFLRSCLRREVIKSVATRDDKIGRAHEHANNWLIAQGHNGKQFTLDDTRYALDLAITHMAEAPARNTGQPANKTYLTATATDNVPDTNDRLLQLQDNPDHMAFLLNFYDKNKPADKTEDRGRQNGRGRGAKSGGKDARGGGRGGGPPRDQTPGPPRDNQGAKTGGNKRCTIKGCPTPDTHYNSGCEYNAQKVMDRKHERDKDASSTAFFSSLAGNKPGTGADCSYYSCLSETDVSHTSASPCPSAPPPSSNFWTAFAPASATCYVAIDCDTPASAVLDSGASVDITSHRHRTGTLSTSPELVQGISGTTDAWPTRVQWHSKTDCGVPHLLQTSAGFKDFKQLYMPNAPDQILSLSQLVEAGYVPHFRPSAQKSWLTTPCNRRITVSLINGVWRLPLWQDSAHPRILHSPISGVLRASRTFAVTNKQVSWQADRTPSSEVSDSGELCQAPRPEESSAAHVSDSEEPAQTTLATVSDSGEPLQTPLATVSNSGEPLQAPLATDSDNFDIHVEEYIIRERNEEHEPDQNHLHMLAALDTTYPSGLPLQPQRGSSAPPTAYRALLSAQDAALCPARHQRFLNEQSALNSPGPPESGRSTLKRAANRKRKRKRADLRKHQREVYSTHVCPTTLAAPCPAPASCTRCAYVGKSCTIADTQLPWICHPCAPDDVCLMAAGSTQTAYNRRPLSPEDETMMQALHDKWCHPSNSKFIQIYKSQHRVGFPTNFLALLNRFRCKVCALCKGARGYRRSARVQLKGPHKTPKPAQTPDSTGLSEERASTRLSLPEAELVCGDIVFVDTNAEPTIGVVTSVSLDDSVTVLLQNQHTQTFPSSDLLLAEEVADEGDRQVSAAEDNSHAPSASEEPPATDAGAHAGDQPARNISIDFGHSLSLGFHKEEYYLVIHADGVELLWCAPTPSRAAPHELIQEFLNYSGIRVRSIRFDNAMEFGQSAHFKSWADAKGAVLCPAVNYNHTLNSKSECYVRITKEHLRCMLLSSNAPRRLWPFALHHFCRIFGWWPKSDGPAPWTRVGSECQIPANLDRDLHAFGSYCIGHLPRESKLVANTTLDDRGLEGAFLMSDHTTPTFWMWSFKFNKPMKMCDGIFYPQYPFRDPSILQHTAHLSHEDVRAMHEADGAFDQEDMPVPHYDLRSHAAPPPAVQPDLAAQPPRQQNIDSSNVLGDVNAPQSQTRAQARHQHVLPSPTTQIYTAPSLLARKDYRGWTLGMHIPAHAELELLSDVQLGKVLVHHQYMLELPAGYFKHPDTGDAMQAVTVVAKAIQKSKGFVYLLADIIGPAALLQDNLAELHVPIRSGNTPRTQHSYTIRNHLTATFAHPQTLADIGISKQAHFTHLAALRTAWQTTRRDTIKHRVQLAAAQQTIQRIEQQAPNPSAFYQQVLAVIPPIPHTLPFSDPDRNKVWLAIVSDSKVDANLLASIDMLQPDPAHRGDAMASNFRPFWLTAEQEEWDGLWTRKCFKVWKRADLATDDRVFTSRYVYKLKRDAISGKVSRFKARLIVQGFKMQQDIDYNDTFSPTPGSTATRAIISIATAEDLELHSVDFTQAFIQADRLPEGVNGRFFITPPPGSPHANTSGIVYEVLRPLYGVPSSPRALHKTLDSYFKSEGFVNAGFEESVWRRPADAKYTADIVISCHVDDSLIACSSLSVMRQFKSTLLKRFAGTDEGPVTQYLGCQLIRDRKNRTSQLVQTAYTERLLHTFGMWDNVHTVATPMEPGTRLVKADCPLTPNLVLQRRYRSIVGSIGYLVQMTRCDLAFAYGQLSQFLHNPGLVHMAAAERALAYVRGTADWGLTYYDLGADKRNVLTGWVDSDFASDSDTRRSVTGYVMSLNGAPISWRSCRQGGVTLSSSEAEYVAASAVAQENAYLRSLLSGFDRPPLGPTCVWEDNAACILMSENPVNRDRSRHVDVKFHFLRERVRAGEIKLFKCWGPLNVADALTKSLPRPAFHKHSPFMHGTRCPYQPFAAAGA